MWFSHYPARHFHTMRVEEKKYVKPKKKLAYCKSPSHEVEEEAKGKKKGKKKKKKKLYLIRFHLERSKVAAFC